MQKYLPVYVVQIAISVFLFLTLREWQYLYIIQIALIFLSFGIGGTMFPILRKEVLQRVKAIDQRAYEVLRDIPPKQPLLSLNTRANYPFNEATMCLIKWWNFYIFLTLFTSFLEMALNFITF